MTSVAVTLLYLPGRSPRERDCTENGMGTREEYSATGRGGTEEPQDNACTNIARPTPHNSTDRRVGEWVDRQSGRQASGTLGPKFIDFYGGGGRRGEGTEERTCMGSLNTHTHQLLVCVCVVY